MEISSKDSIIQNLKVENEQLQEKNKKWISKLDQEIEKSSQNVGMLTKQIKELQEKNYRLEIDQMQKQGQIEKKAFKDQVDEVKRMENELREKNDMIEELEMNKFNIEELLQKEQNKMKNEMDDMKMQLRSIDEKYQAKKHEFDSIEEQLIEKDEMCKDLEEKNIMLNENLRIYTEKLEDLGETKSNFMETIKNEKNNHGQDL